MTRVSAPTAIGPIHLRQLDAADLAALLACALVPWGGSWTHLERAGFRGVAHRDRLNELTLVIMLTCMWGFVGANRAGIGFVLPALLPERN